MKKSETRNPKSEIRRRPRERGIALVIVLGVLVVILLLAVAFALSARTEAKSGASYDFLVNAKAITKMGLDRCIMEAHLLSEPKPYSGGKTTVYTTNDLTRIDGSFLYDTNPVFASFPADFVDINQNNVRDETEPYWIAVRDASGRLVGRFAYTVIGDPTAGAAAPASVLDINGIGSYTNVGGVDTYVRRGDGYVGDTNNGYTIGIAGDINLVAFLRKLGYSDPEESARRILAYRYGWPGGAGAPPHGTYYPRGNLLDDNGIAGVDDFAEHQPHLPTGGTNDDQRITDIQEVMDVPIDTDPAHSNLLLYAHDGPSTGDDNSAGLYTGTRLNLNDTRTGNTADVAAVVAMLQKALPTNDLDQLTQWAVNLVDFHTTNLYPTVFTGGIGGTNTFIGMKRTPYLNQLRNLYTSDIQVSGTNARLRMIRYPPAEIWNPYEAFPTAVVVYATNIVSWHTATPVPNLSGASTVWTGRYTFSTSSGYPPVPGYTWRQEESAGQEIYSPYFPSNYLPFMVTVSNVVFYSVTVQSSPYLLSRGMGIGTTNVIVSLGMPATFIVCNMEADDPRIGYLYNQPASRDDAGAWMYGLGISNRFTWADQGGPTGADREGLASFASNKINQAYAGLGDLGYVYRGEPLKGSNAVGAWQTIRLQPGGEGMILDYVRVSALNGVRGRVNINAHTNGPGGAPYQSPALWALFDGLSIPGYGALSSNKIVNIIAELGAYRDSLPPTIQDGVTNNIFTNIGQICEITELFSDNSGSPLPVGNDAVRESLIRSIADLITVGTKSIGGEYLAWGQAIRGNVPSGIIQIRAVAQSGAGNRIKFTRFRYLTQ